MPPRELFNSAEEYYATLFHEMAHYADARIMPTFFGWHLRAVR